jgi:hypothetical protein
MVRKILWGLGVVLVLIVVVAGTLYFNRSLRNFALFSPWRSFDVAAAPAPPDYATTAAWAVLPDHPGAATSVPPGSDAADAETTAPVDVFFIHPTTFFGRANWNARFDEDGETLDRLDNGVVRYQTSAFNGCCRIYAPRYRQATLYAFLGKGASENGALDLAYQDVLRAFDTYIAKYNDGRPFILAGHSQGSLHGMRLLQEHIAGTPLVHRMVAAYLVGYAIPLDLRVPDGTGPCRGPTDLGCYLSWNSLSETADRSGWQQNTAIWLDKQYQPIAGRALTCMNPLDWTLDGSEPAAANLGSVGFGLDGVMPALQKAATGAACIDGVLIVAPPTKDEHFTYGVFGGNYHIYDYNLFYMNIRQNLADRIGAYEKAVAARQPQESAARAP